VTQEQCCSKGILGGASAEHPLRGTANHFFHFYSVQSSRKKIFWELESGCNISRMHG